MTTVDQPGTLRERKKLRTRAALADTAVILFSERGFDNTPLDALLEVVEVSRRTFFRNYRSKEDVALTAVTHLWNEFLVVFDESEQSGPLTELFRDTMLTTLDRMDDSWYQRFPRTLELVDQSPALNGHTLRHCAQMRSEITRRLTAPDSLELRLVLEFCVATWRCALEEWHAPHTPEDLREATRRAFAAMDTSLRLRV
ncbi:TetR family transcriptional regulator [Nocardia callitridis]|uniref:TetR family transcriptional regulator n=1 Tax=Nocardia callitridis TaxID=648753 RepID=A0ABP9K7B2_9NOCA